MRHKVVKMFPDIINRDAFYNRDHPMLNPESIEYIEYWRKEKKRCIEGRWVMEDVGHWRWMNPLLYFYINHWNIMMIDEVNNARYYAPPDLTDNEWIITSYYTASDGFSGFTGDDNVSCHYLLKKYWDNKNGNRDKSGDLVMFSNVELKRLDELPYVKRSDGKYKEYVEPYEYLKLHQREPLGYALYGNAPENGMTFTARGNGKSFIKSADCGKEFSFGGAKYYENELFPARKNARGEIIPTIGECMVGAGDPSKTLELCYKIDYGLKHFQGEYVSGEKLHPAPFSKQAQGAFDIGKTYKHKYKKKVKGNWKDVSDGSVIYVVNYGTDVDAGASKRLSKQYVDEVGLIEKADQMHGVSKFSKQAGGVKFGKTMYSGTGGSFDKGMAAKRMFYSPEQYEIYSIEDVWENKGRIALFIPAYYSLRQYKDENGNTKVEEALEYILDERKRLSAYADPLPLIQEKMFMPLVPSEMFYSVKENIFPVDLVVERLNELEGDSMLLNDYSAGYLRWGDSAKKTVRWIENVEARKRAIIDMSLDKYHDKSGVVLIYEHPQGEIEKGLYKVVYDMYSIDGQGESYGSILVYKGIPTTSGTGRMRDTIVGEFIGRPQTVEEVHQIAIQLAQYFNTTVQFEDNTQGFKKWAIHNKFYNLLEPEPYESVKDGSKNRKRTHKVGITMNATLKAHALQRLRSWLLEPRDVEDGQTTRTNVHELRSMRLLTELMNYGEGNFDHISSALLLMLWIDQDGKVVKEYDNQEKVDDFEEFFTNRIKGLYNPYV